MNDNARPFFGEEEGIIESPAWRNSNDGERRGTPAARYEWRQAEGLCCHRSGTVFCTGTLDSDGYCSLCGKVSMPPVAPDPEPDFIATIPGALTLDEYAPAQVDEGAA